MRQLQRAADAPAVARRALAVECGGEWGRITEHNGEFTVHNNVGRARAAVERHTPPTQPESPALPSAAAPASPKPAPPRREPRPEARVLTEAVQSNQRETPLVESEAAPTPRREITWTEAEGEGWPIDVTNASVLELQAACANGLPPGVPFGYLDLVEDLQGVDLSGADAALRAPHRVEVRPETAVKGYPVLSFHRGDVTAILGLRDRHRPIIIAAYFTSILSSDSHAGVHRGTAPNNLRAPRSVESEMAELRKLGADVEVTGRTAEVVYQGESLGRITVENASRREIESDYKRISRRLAARFRRLL